MFPEIFPRSAKIIQESFLTFCLTLMVMDFIHAHNVCSRAKFGGSSCSTANNSQLRERKVDMAKCAKKKKKAAKKKTTKKKAKKKKK